MTFWIILGLIAVAGAAAYNFNLPQPLRFHSVGSFYGSKFKTLPENFPAAWEWVEANLASKSALAQPSCPICQQRTGGAPNGYCSQYRYKNYTWTDTDHKHIMYGHVEYGDESNGYFMPDPGFVTMIMQAYARHAPAPPAQPAQA